MKACVLSCMKKIKTKIKSFLGYDTLIWLKIRKTFLTDNWKAIKVNRKIRQNVQRSKQKLLQNQKLKVLFIVQFPEMWSSLKSLYAAFVEDSRYEVLLYAVPLRTGTTGECDNKAFRFFVKDGYPVINAYAEGAFREIEEDCDFIFVQRPYDQFMPEEYRLSALSTKGLVCYVPYSGRMTHGIHINIEFNSALLCNAFAIFADCDESFRYVKSWYCNHFVCRERQVFNIGFPRYDLVCHFFRSNVTFESKQSCESFLWLPRWTLESLSDASNFFLYIDFLLDFFRDNPTLSLIIRPHPLMFSNFLEKGAMTQEELKTMMDTIDSLPNVSIDENADYLISFSDCNALIADPTSLLREFCYTGKPVIFCGKYTALSKLTDVAQKIYDTFYIVNSVSEMEDAMTALVDGRDSKLVDRQSVYKELLKMTSGDSKRFTDELYRCL